MTKEMPPTHSELLEQIAQAAQAGGPAENCTYEQAFQGLMQAADKFRKVVAVSNYLDAVTKLDASCPDFIIDVPDPAASGGMIRAAIPIGDVIRAQTKSEDDCQMVLRQFFTVPQLWVLEEHERCLTNLERSIASLRALSQKTSARPAQ